MLDTNTTDAFELLADIQKVEAVKMARATRRDPYNRKRRRKGPRGSKVLNAIATAKRQGIKDFYKEMPVVNYMLHRAQKNAAHDRYLLAVKSQREIERWLNSRDYKWRDLELQIDRLHKGKWRFIEQAMTAFGHVPQAQGGAQ